MEKTELIVELTKLIPDMEHGRETHRQWRDCDQIHRDKEPSIGDKDFHTRLVTVYDNRIRVIQGAINYILNKFKLFLLLPS